MGFEVPSNPTRASIRASLGNPTQLKDFPEPVELITYVFSSDFGRYFFHRLILCSSCPCYLQVADVLSAVSFQEAGKDHSLFAFCLALWNGWVSSSLLPSWRKTLFYPASPTCPFPILTSTVLPHSATAPVWCSAALWAFLSPGKSSAGLESQNFNFWCFSWRSTLAKSDVVSVSAASYCTGRGTPGQKSWPVSGLSGPVNNVSARRRVQCWCPVLCQILTFPWWFFMHF